MDAQLVQVAKQIEEEQVSYWLNSGTLLGVVRDGRLIDGDRDIDISVWWYDADKILQLANRWKADGYRIDLRKYRGQVCKIKAKSSRDEAARTIDIEIYRTSGNFAWCPQHVSRIRRKSLGYRVFRPVYYLLANGMNRVTAQKTAVTKESGLLYRVHTWWIPSRFFEERDVHVLDGVAFPVPSPVEEYLTFRYGDWRTPNPDWVCERDDGGLVGEAPETLMRTLLHAA